MQLLLVSYKQRSSKDSCTSAFLFFMFTINPANTQRRYNVAATSRRCSDVVATLCVYWIKNHKGEKHAPTCLVFDIYNNNSAFALFTQKKTLKETFLKKSLQVTKK